MWQKGIFFQFSKGGAFGLIVSETVWNLPQLNIIGICSIFSVALLCFCVRVTQIWPLQTSCRRRKRRRRRRSTRRQRRKNRMKKKRNAKKKTTKKTRWMLVLLSMSRCTFCLFAFSFFRQKQQTQELFLLWWGCHFRTNAQLILLLDAYLGWQTMLSCITAYWNGVWNKDKWGFSTGTFGRAESSHATLIWVSITSPTVPCHARDGLPQE